MLLKFIAVECVLVLPALIRVHDQTLYRRKPFKRFIQHKLGVSRDRVRQIEWSGIQKLRGLPGLSRWRDEVISTRAWRGTGFGAWKSGGSVQERTAEYLEKREAERWDYPAWRDKVLREHYAELEAAGFFERHPDWRPAEKPTEITH